jgi:hypothetical protein
MQDRQGNPGNPNTTEISNANMIRIQMDLLKLDQIADC